jgi:endonuclease YncB( thermonuclease family)
MGNCLYKETLATTNLEINNSNIKLIESTYDIPVHSFKDTSMEGKVVNVYDGDTVHVVFVINNKLVKYNCRLLGIDSPEICPKNVHDKTKRELEIASAIKSRNFLISQVTGVTPIESITKKEIKELCGKSRKLIWIKCDDFDKYGRLLIEIFLDKNNPVSLNKKMVLEKYAVEYDGGTKKEFSPSYNIEV